MEKFKHKNGTGSLFLNDKKTKENQPVLKGTIVTPDGTEYRVSAWQKEGKKGTFYSLAVEAAADGNAHPTHTGGLPF